MPRSFTRFLLFSSFTWAAATSSFGQYCTPTYNNACSSGDFIENFSFKSIVNNASGCSGNPDNYIYYSSGPTTTVKRGEPVSLSMQSGPSYYQGFGVWIDYNQDGDFDDQDEFVYASPGPSTAMFYGSATIPNSASLGTTRLRVRCNYASSVYSNQSCTNFVYGETEDYDITIAASSTQISFTPSALATCVNVVDTFTNTSTDPQAYEFRWDFGDGTTLVDTLSVQVAYAYPSAGNFTVQMYVYDNTGAFVGSDSRVINVQAGTNGWFNMSKDSACPGEPLYLDPNGNNTFVKWHMSDGWTSTNWWEYRSLNTPGTYTVNCICSTNCGVDTISRVFKVVNTIPANSDFSFYTTPSCPNTNVNFYPVDYSGTHLWNFGDGGTSTFSSSQHKYTALGTYTVLHTATNLCGNSSTDTMTLNIVDTIYPTNAVFNFNPNTTICPGISVSFQSQNYDGQWSWNFGDGNTATGQYPKHTYTTPGTYTVTHTITNNCGKTLSTTATITISGTLTPDTLFSWSPLPACPNDLVNFNPSEQYGKTYLWDFGDGATSSLKNPSHKYAAVGNYPVKLTVKNYCNITASHTDTVRIIGTLPINISSNLYVNPQPACPTQPLNFDAGVWGFPVYIWNYGDGVTDTTAMPYIQHSYSLAGTYTASVTIANNCGQDTTLFKTVNINSAIPFPGLGSFVNPKKVCPGESIYANAPWGYPSYEWNMGDGTAPIVSANHYISYSYTATGSYPISVKVTDFCGRDTTYRDTISTAIKSTFCSGGCPLFVNANYPVCPNENVNFNATQGYTWYKWFFSATDSVVSSSNQVSHSYSAAGTYNYSVTITNFCGVDTTVYGSLTIDNTIQVPSWINVNAYPDFVCPNQEVQFNTDNSYSSYLWRFGDGYVASGTGNATHTYTATGVYTASVTVTNACGNSATVTTQVTVDSAATFPSWISLYNYPDPACPGSAVTLETQAGYVSYTWLFGDGDTLVTTTAKVTHTYASAGNYSASVLIVNSCGESVTVYRTVNINNNVNINWLDIFPNNNPACPGDVLTMHVNASVPLSDLTLVWDYGDGSPLDTTIGAGASHVFAAPGVYNVVVTGTNACGKSRTASRLITINSTASPQLNVWSFGVLAEGAQINAVCPGDVIVFYFEGTNTNNLWNFGDGNTGVATDVFVRSDGVTITTIKHAYATAGTYNYSLKLGNHCNNFTTVSKSISVNSGMLMSGGFMISPASSTLGYTTCGLINFVAFGGKNFTWDFGDGNILTTLSPSMGHSYVNPGNYTVKVTITNGCGNSATYMKTLIVNGTGGTSVSTTSVVSPTCNGGTNGSAAALVSGGQAPYAYTWFDNLGQLVSTNISASNLPGGTYTVNVTDNNGCMGSTVVTLNNPAAITFSLSATPSSCGGSTGSASVSSITNGTVPYTYSWTNGQTTAIATGLSMGTYPVTVLDANGCSSSGSASVSENGAVVSIVSTTSVSCNGGNNGAVNINITGGTMPYAFIWSNGATTQNLTGLTAGNYSVVVSDNGGCQSSINATITESALLVVNPTTAQAPTCGNFNGKATANVSGGKSPYAYLWDANSGSQTTQTATGLPAGTYSVTVTDANSCTTDATITLSNANSPIVTSVVSPISCNGATDGAIDLTVSGGTSPYLYTWNVSPANQQDQTNLAPGFYFVSIQDAAGCLTVKSFNLTSPAVLNIVVNSSAAMCGTPGSAIASPTGGTSPYSYSWSSGANSSQTATGLTTGSYSVTVTDSRGCTATASVTVGFTTASIPVCMVTVDTTSTKNVVIWDKPVSSVIDSFVIFREIASVFTRVGATDYSALSRFTDATAGVNPNITSYRYEISVKDNCASESAKSAPHRTINLSVNPHSPCGYTLFWNDYSGFPVTQYRIWRDSSGDGWKAVDSVSFGTTQWIDNTCFLPTDSIQYFLETDHPNGCVVSMADPSPDAINLNSSKSNVYRIKDSTLTYMISPALAGDDITLLPNPNNGNFTVVSGKTKVVRMDIIDMLGREVSGSVSWQNGRCNVSIPYSKGVYMMRVVTPSGIINKKFIVE